MPGRACGIKMEGMAEMGATITLDGVAVHLDHWCICLCDLDFAPENPEDGEQRYDIWVSPRGCPHMPTQRVGGETQPECSITLCMGARL